MFLWFVFHGFPWFFDRFCWLLMVFDGFRLAESLRPPVSEGAGLSEADPPGGARGLGRGGGERGGGEAAQHLPGLRLLSSMDGPPGRW